MNTCRYIINQKSSDGLQAQYNAAGFREDFSDGSFIQVVNSDKDNVSEKKFLDDIILYGKVEEHTMDYHLVLNPAKNRAFETRSDGTQIDWFTGVL